MVKDLGGPLDGVQVGRELVLRRSARRDVPEDGEKGREVGGVLERGDDGTRRGHCDESDGLSTRIFFAVPTAD